MATPLHSYAHFFIWGLGREGKAVLETLSDLKVSADIVVVDAKRPLELPAGVTYLPEAQMAAAIASSSNALLIKSPGISLYDRRVDAALRAGARLTSQTNLFFELKPAEQRVIAITGTKGKSTSAALTHHMLQALDHSAALAGNIGVPVLQAPKDAQTIVLELSSYQIADLVHAPDAFIFLNMMSDHAPWHHGLDRYRRDKMRLAQLDPNTLGIMNATDSVLTDAFADQPNRVWFGTEQGFHVKDGAVWQRQECFGDVPNLPGEHNALNVCAALTLVETLGFDPEAAFRSLADFKGLSHRLQTVHTIGDVDFIDDALATTPESCVLAVKALKDRPCALILGGEDRNQDYDLLRAALDELTNLEKIVTTPDNGPVIAQALLSGRHGDKVYQASDLPLAVEEAYASLNGRGAVLLSPAAPRGKDFSDFAHRGAVFLKAAQAIG